VLIYNWIFTALILTAGIVYYDLFHHATEISSSSECGDPHLRTKLAEGLVVGR
jgi:hypothetical protein